MIYVTIIILSTFLSLLPVLIIILPEEIKKRRKNKREVMDVSERYLSKLNSLNKCGDCNRLFRTYQVFLTIIKEELYLHEHLDEDGFMVAICPHCYTQRGFQKVEKEYEWMKTNGDCPVIDEEGARNIKKMIKHTEEMIKEREEIDSFMEYNKLSPEDMSWVQNLIRENKNKNQQE